MQTSPAAKVAIFFIKMYKVLLSPLLGKNCRFIPTCSSYAIEAYQLHGFLKGSWLTAKRILRCNPWGGKGCDPVPLPAGNKEERDKDV